MATDSSSSSRNDDEAKLGWKDYLAFIIAAFETILVPLLVFAVVLLVILAIVRWSF